MSLVRAFTLRHKRQPEMQISAPTFLGRAASQRGGKPVLRAHISSPVALLSTSNMLLNNAQDIVGTSPIDIHDISPISSSSSMTSSSPVDSDASSGHHSAGSITDASSIDESPISCQPEPNHLSCYFQPAVDTDSRPPSQPTSPSGSLSFDAPRLPRRVPSHSKKAHEKVHRTRSIQRMMSPPPSTAYEACESHDAFTLTKASFIEAPKESPFGAELAQLDEVAEEFGHVVRDAEDEADFAVMKSTGFACLSASDYLSEIQDLIYDTFGEPASHSAGWI
ncbi:hypothetical protein LTR02_013387 [Friedmanniomyces endolithicus]|nr:hypothetical protein LTR94_016852 [Friedmanniomyces endolithicus]KAK0775602.1 hypothetical protein LTR59_014461 [Friedmanniomyces endolithicus]KAK0780319.1 hypothetical protein LTR38_014108 [Friedmanniomyces endolithicus]KAK0782898.1 hypothetical protein LTR75_014282 [Friedmanniomyces endolithicus]KAK0854707.1 hypothetical protein LTR03_002140 [Friedmanniomyces endolithicus]